MKPTILIKSSVAIAAPMSAVFSVPMDRPVSIFARGLVLLEKAVIEMQTEHVSDPALEVWLPIKLSGNELKLDTGNNWMEMRAPGRYRVTVNASSGPVTIGMY